VDVPVYCRWRFRREDHRDARDPKKDVKEFQKDVN
jgi:hypothetical protein